MENYLASLPGSFHSLGASMIGMLVLWNEDDDELMFNHHGNINQANQRSMVKWRQRSWEKFWGSIPRPFIYACNPEQYGIHSAMLILKIINNQLPRLCMSLKVEPMRWQWLSMGVYELFVHQFKWNNDEFQVRLAPAVSEMGKSMVPYSLTWLLGLTWGGSILISWA